MTTSRKRLLGLAATGLLIVGAVFYVQAQAPATPGEHSGHGQMNMPGMEMPAPATRPATAAASLPGDYAEVTVAPAVQQRIGVMLGQVEQTPLTMRIRTVGIVRPNETQIAHIHLKTEGWVTKLAVAYTGQKVKAGDEMLSIYSPAFFTAQREFLTALQAAKATPSPDQSIVVEASRRRLELWDVPKDQIEALEKTGKALTALPLKTPISGTVLEKKAFAGQYVAPQDELYMVADLSTVWVQAKVFEYELPHIALGMPATVTLPAYPRRVFAGKIVFIDPTVEEPARTVQVRIELPNEKGELKPGMFGNVMIEHEMGRGLTVPDSAVIRTGTRDLAYLAAGEGRFVPVEVKISPLHFEDRFQVLAGLKAGERVVTSANFLIDSESRLRGGGGSMAGMAGMDMGEIGGGKKPSPKPQEPMPGMDMAPRGK